MKEKTLVGEILITEEVTLRILEGLNASHSARPGGIHPAIVKAMVRVVCKFICSSDS